MNAKHTSPTTARTRLFGTGARLKARCLYIGRDRCGGLPRWPPGPTPFCSRAVRLKRYRTPSSRPGRRTIYK